MKFFFKVLCSRNRLFQRRDVKKIIKKIGFPKDNIGRGKRRRLKKKLEEKRSLKKKSSF